MEYKFLLNEDEWHIKIISNEEMNKKTGENEKDCFTHGLTCYDENIIYLNEKSPNKKKSLIHELEHCYLYEYGFNPFNKQFDLEDVCEIIAGSFEIIKKIVEDYFGR